MSVQAITPAGASALIAASTSSVQYGLLGHWDTNTIVNETSVRITLAAEDINGNIGNSSVDVVVDNAPPLAPSGLQATLVGSDIQLTWHANTESDLLGYLLYRNGKLLNWQGSPPLDPAAAVI